MIIGAHSIVYSQNPEADREFFRDVLALPHVDVGGGWLIFGLPPAEVAVHPGAKNDVHEFYLMVDDVEALRAALKDRGVACGPTRDRGWGLLTEVTLPGGGTLGVYQPRHGRPKPMAVSGRKQASRKKTAAKKAPRKPARKAKKGAPRRR